eukprot:g2090.t1
MPSPVKQLDNSAQRHTGRPIVRQRWKEFHSGHELKDGSGSWAGLTGDAAPFDRYDCSPGQFLFLQQRERITTAAAEAEHHYRRWVGLGKSLTVVCKFCVKL